MFAVALLMGWLTALADGRIYDRCELARDLQLLGVDRDQIATWVCIAYHESRYDTAAQNFGSGDHGLLQISELYWCGPGKACGAPCSAFRDEDISDDVRCALQIHKEHTILQGDGFLAWVVYPYHCKQNAKKYIVDCEKNLKNTPVKFDDRTRYPKNFELSNEIKPQFVNNPYQNTVTPRYLSINSIFQGSYVHEFERNYYENNKQSNWLDFKVDNIDDLVLPGVLSEKQRSYFIESTSRPITATTLDPALIGIKPPSPKRIESNQFRRRKTFSQPLFLKNRFTDDQKISKTTPVSVRENSENSLSLNKDLSHNFFLNLSPSVISKSLREFSSHDIKSTDLSRYHVKTPQLEESSSSAVLSYNDLAQNPFLNSLPGFNFKSKTESPFRTTNDFRGYTSTTSRPSLRTSKQIESMRSPELYSNKPESSKTSSQTDADDTKLTIGDLAENPFLSRLLRVNTIKPSTIHEMKLLDSRGNYRNENSFTTAKPTTKLASSSPKDLASRREQYDISTKIPTWAQKESASFLSNFDNTITETPSTESSTTVTYSTRRYQTISRQRSSSNQNDFKSTTPIVPLTEMPNVSTTIKHYTDDLNRRNFKIDTTTSRSTITVSKPLDNVTKVNNVEVKLQKESLLQGRNRTEITNRPQTTRRPETANRLRTIDRTTIRPQVTSSREITSVSLTTSRPQTTSRLQPTSRLGITGRPQVINKTETTGRSQKIGNTRTASAQTTKTPQTTSRPQTTSSRLQSTSRPLTISRIQFTSRQENTSKPLTTSRQQTINRTVTISSPQTTSNPEIMRGPQTTSRQTTSRPDSTSRPSTTLRSWSSWRSQEEPRNNRSMTPRPNFTWTKPTNSALSSTTRYYSTSTQKPSTTSTEASTAKTTLSIFDLYLRPATQSSFKPFEFTSLNRLRKGISIFSGGTTKPPPAYLTNTKPVTEEVLRN